MNSFIDSDIDYTTDAHKSYNEEDVMNKLATLKMAIDPITGELKYLNELNSLGKRKKKLDQCASEKKSSKSKQIY